MTRQAFEQYIAEYYGVCADYPWDGDSETAVFRHVHNKKWFALVMTLSSRLLGEEGDAMDVVNLKCDPMMVGALCGDDGIYPAYHMNKTHWITVALDERVEDDKLLWLLAQSAELTAK